MESWRSGHSGARDKVEEVFSRTGANHVGLLEKGERLLITKSKQSLRLERAHISETPGRGTKLVVREDCLPQPRT